MVFKKNAIVLAVLFAVGCSTEESSREAFKKAVDQNEDQQVVAFLQKYPNLAKLNKQSGRPVFLTAVQNGNLKIVKAFLDHGADAKYVGDDPLLNKALANGPADEVVSLLLQHGADPNQSTGSTASVFPLHRAAELGDVQSVVALLKAGADANAVSARDGTTALHAAVATGRVRIVQELISAGARPNVKDKTGLTPIDLAEFVSTPQKTDAELQADLRKIRDSDSPTALSESVKLVAQNMRRGKVLAADGQKMVQIMKGQTP